MIEAARETLALDSTGRYEIHADPEGADLGRKGRDEHVDAAVPVQHAFRRGVDGRRGAQVHRYG